MRRGVRIPGFCLMGVWLAAGAWADDGPGIRPGQEGAITAALQGAALPAGATLGDVEVRGRTLQVAVHASGQVAHVLAEATPEGAWQIGWSEACGLGPACDPALAAVARAVAPLRLRFAGAADGPRQGDEVAARLREADEHLRVARPAEARRAALQAAEAIPTQAPVGRALLADVAALLARVGEVQAARALADRALAGLPADPSPGAALAVNEDGTVALSRIAAAAVWVGRKHDAVRWLAECARCDPIPLSDALELAGEPSTAAALLDRSLAAPRAPPALFRARIGLASRRDDSAAETRVAEAAVARFPTDLDLQDALGTAYFRGGRHEAAIRTFEALHRRDPQRKDVLGKLAGVIGDLGRTDDEAARQGRPSSGAFSRIRAEFQQRAARDPTDTVAQFVAAVSVFYDGRFDEALKLLAAVGQKVPNEGRVHIYTGMAHLWLGHEEPAARAIQRALEVNPHDPDVYYCQSQVLRLHDLPAAARALERYVALAASPGALQFPHKTERVRQELAMLRAGQLPPLWDKPGHFAHAETAANPWLQLRVLGWLGGAAVVAAVVIARWWRRRPLAGAKRPP